MHPLSFFLVVLDFSCSSSSFGLISLLEDGDIKLEGTITEGLMGLRLLFEDRDVQLEDKVKGKETLPVNFV